MRIQSCRCCSTTPSSPTSYRAQSKHRSIQRKGGHFDVPQGIAGGHPPQKEDGVCLHHQTHEICIDRVRHLLTRPPSRLPLILHLADELDQRPAERQRQKESYRPLVRILLQTRNPHRMLSLQNKYPPPHIVSEREEE